MTEPTQFELTDGEKTHPLWLKLKAYLETRLAQARSRNDGLLSPDETAALRGQIKCLKGLIALGNDKPPIDG